MLSIQSSTKIEKASGTDLGFNEIKAFALRDEGTVFENGDSLSFPRKTYSDNKRNHIVIVGVSTEKRVVACLE